MHRAGLLDFELTAAVAGAIIVIRCPACISLLVACKHGNCWHASWRRCMEGRRVIFIGDSMSWQMFISLACLLAPITDYSSGGTWDKANTTVTGGYSGRDWPDNRHIMLQYFAQVG